MITTVLQSTIFLSGTDVTLNRTIDKFTNKSRNRKYVHRWIRLLQLPFLHCSCCYFTQEKSSTHSSESEIRQSPIQYIGSLGQMTHSKYYFFHNFLQNALQTSFQFIFLFFHNFTKIKIKTFECPNYEKNNASTKQASKLY